jgi:hypothetical protein
LVRRYITHGFGGSRIEVDAGATNRPSAQVQDDRHPEYFFGPRPLAFSLLPSISNTIYKNHVNLPSLHSHRRSGPRVFPRLFMNLNFACHLYLCGISSPVHRWNLRVRDYLSQHYDPGSTSSESVSIPQINRQVFHGSSSLPPPPLSLLARPGTDRPLQNGGVGPMQGQRA